MELIQRFRFLILLSLSYENLENHDSFKLAEDMNFIAIKIKVSLFYSNL